MLRLWSFLGLSLLFPSAFAACPLEDVSADGSAIVGKVMTEPAVCQSTGPGTMTFAMTSDLTAVFFGVTTPDGQWPEGTLTASKAIFYIMDNTCKVLGLYQPNDNCNLMDGGEYIEANFLKYVLTVTAMDSGVGSGYFQFAYANGLYSIGNNHCTCSSMPSKFNQAAMGCKCAFPVGGETVKRRSIESPYESLQRRATTPSSGSRSQTQQKGSASQQTSQSTGSQQSSQSSGSKQTQGKQTSGQKSSASAGDSSDGQVGSTGHQQALQAMKDFKAKGGKLSSPEKGKAKPNPQGKIKTKSGQRPTASNKSSKSGSTGSTDKPDSTTKTGSTSKPGSTGKTGSTTDRTSGSSSTRTGATGSSRGSTKSLRSLNDNTWLDARGFDDYSSSQYDFDILARDALIEELYDDYGHDLYARSFDDDEYFYY